MNKLILASKSPRRRELLDRLGLAHTVISIDTDEWYPDDLSPVGIVNHISREKAAAAATMVAPEDVVITADTMVFLDNRKLGKPQSEEEAFEMLSSLSGREHTVYTGVTVCRGGQILTQHEATAVRFRPLTAQEIDAYIATGEPMDKAGSYGIQGRGALLVEGISGDYFNVVGLPVCRLGRMLTQFGVDPLTGM